ALTLLSKPTNRLAGEIDPDTLYLRVQFERVLAHLASVARLLVAPERRCGIEHVVSIDPDDARFDCPSEAMCPRDIARPDSRGQAIDRVIRFLNQFIVIFESDDT